MGSKQEVVDERRNHRHYTPCPNLQAQEKHDALPPRSAPSRGRRAPGFSSRNGRGVVPPIARDLRCDAGIEDKSHIQEKGGYAHPIQKQDILSEIPDKLTWAARQAPRNVPILRRIEP